MASENGKTCSNGSEPHLPEQCAVCPVSGITEWMGLDPLAADILTNARKLTRFEAGDEIFSQGDRSEGVYCLMSGLILLKHVDVFGNETAFRMLFPGQTCGWRSLFAEQAHMAHAIALEQSDVCMISKADLNRMIDSDNDLARRYLKIMARDPGPADAVLLRNAFLPARVRLINLMLILSEQCLDGVAEGEICYRLPVQRKHIAALIGVSVETVSRTIKELEDDGLVKFEKRDVFIPDIDRLRRETR